MNKVINVDVLHLKNALHFQFFMEVRDLINRLNAETLKVTDLFSALVNHLNDEDLALKKIVKSERTQLIQDADKARDETYGCLVGIMHYCLKHFNPQKREAARKLKILFETYGNLLKMGLNEQTSNLYNLLQDLCSSKYSAYVNSLGLGEWVEELQNRNSALDALVKERFEESTTKCTIVLRDARVKVDTTYHAIIERINALVVVEGVALYQDFITTMNSIISRYRLYAKSHRHRHYSGEGEEITPPAVEE